MDTMIIGSGTPFHQDLPPQLAFSVELIRLAHSGDCNERVELECRAGTGLPDILRVSLPSGRDYVYVLDDYDKATQVFPAHWPD
jgi:hypothetical protein